MTNITCWVIEIEDADVTLSFAPSIREREKTEGKCWRFVRNGQSMEKEQQYKTEIWKRVDGWKQENHELWCMKVQIQKVKTFRDKNVTQNCRSPEKGMNYML